MNRVSHLRHEFVEYIPDEVHPGVLYVTMTYATAVHLCCCGCGLEVVTPLSPTDWKLVFDGETVSLKPSIGNWSFPCRSHYWVRRNRVDWAEGWSKERIEAGRRSDEAAKKRQFSEAAPHAHEPVQQAEQAQDSHHEVDSSADSTRPQRGLLARLWAWVAGGRDG